MTLLFMRFVSLSICLCLQHQNMTTLCENWACTYHEAGGGSQNHIMLGGFDSWLHSAFGGLETGSTAATGAGWRHVTARVAPGAITRLGSGRYARITRFGTTSLRWKWAAMANESSWQLEMQFQLPVGTTGTVHSPKLLWISDGNEAGSAVELTEVYEGNSNLWSSIDRLQHRGMSAKLDGFSEVTETENAILSTVESGAYTFVGRYRQR